MIDYFRLPANVTTTNDITAFVSDFEKADAIQDCIADDISDKCFVPYIQMHEFEAFLFVSHYCL